MAVSLSRAACSILAVVCPANCCSYMAVLVNCTLTAAAAYPCSAEPSCCVPYASELSHHSNTHYNSKPPYTTAASNLHHTAHRPHIDDILAISTRPPAQTIIRHAACHQLASSWVGRPMYSQRAGSLVFGAQHYLRSQALACSNGDHLGGQRLASALSILDSWVEQLRETDAQQQQQPRKSLH